MKSTTSDEEARRARSDWAAQHLSVTDIRLNKLAAELRQAQAMLPLQTSTAFKTAEYDRVPGIVLYYVGYQVSAQDGSRRIVWEASFGFSVSFRVRDEKEVSDSDLEAFGAHGVIEIAHPYARELVQSLTFRMRVPTFILEVLPMR